MHLCQWMRLVILIFIFNGTYLGNAAKWEEMESSCEGSGGGEEVKDKIPKDLQQLIMTLIMVTGVLVIRKLGDRGWRYFCW